MGRPGVFVPYPSATDNHQVFNATQLTESGGGWLREQNEITPKLISNLITRLVSNPSVLLAAASRAKDFVKVGCKENLTELIEDLIHLNSKSRMFKKGPS